MIPDEISLTNFMCYREDVPPLQLDGLHIACLSGDNGAGKSALLDAITWALWGKARMSDDELMSQGTSEMQVRLSFVLGDQHYRVLRRRQRGKTGKRGKVASGKSSLDLQIWGETGWRALSETSVSETQQKIDQLLRMKYDTFINASFLLQGRADEFTRKTPAERKEVLADILDLGEYAALETRARERARELQAQIDGLDYELARLQREAELLELLVPQTAQAEERATHLQADLAQAEEAQRTADEAVRTLETHRVRRNELLARLANLRVAQRQQQEEIETLRQKIAADEAVQQRAEEIGAGVARLAAAQQEVARLDGLQPRYDELRDGRRQYQDALKDERYRLQRELDRHQQEADSLRAQAARRPTLLADLQQREQELARLAPLDEQVRLLREQRSRVQTLVLRAGELTSAIARQQHALEQISQEQERAIARLERQCRDVARWESELAAAQAAQVALPRLEQELAALRDRDQQTAEQVGELRARCEALRHQAEELKKRQGVLTDEQATTCPLCGNDLGTHGAATILAHYAGELAQLRQSYRASRDEADRHEADRHDLRTQVQAAEARATQARKSATHVEHVQQQLAQAAEWQADLQQARSARMEAEQQLDRAAYALEERAALHEVEDELVALLGDSADVSAIRRPTSPGAARQPRQNRWQAATDHFEQRLQALEQELAPRPKLESAVALGRHELAEAEQATAALPAAERRAAELAATIEHNDFAHEIRQAGRAIDAELAALGYTTEVHSAARQALHDLTHWQAEAQRLELATSRRAESERTLQRYSELAAHATTEIDGLAREELELERQIRELPAATQHASTCQAATARLRQELDVARNDLYEKRTLCARAQAAAEELTRRQQERGSLAERQSIFQELAAACSKKGVQAMLIETAIPEIEREANRLLSRITSNQMHLAFEMQRHTRRGDPVETLEITVADALGTRTYDAFSGGEAMRINFAIRIALSRLLAGRAGASLETLVIDEGMGVLDAEGRERFVEAITSVQHDFKRILVITHLEELKDRFPVRIEITKTPMGSQWAIY